MSLAFVIVLEQEIPGIEPRSFDGRRIAANRHALDAIAHEQDLRGLGEFVAFSQVEAEALADDMKFDAPTVGRTSGRWFRPADGIEVVQGIRDSLSADPEEIEDAMEILASLETLQTILQAALERGVKFRLSLDY